MKKPVDSATPGISCWTARVSRDPVSAARQQLTQEGRDNSRRFVDLVVDRAVLKVISAGDRPAAARRLDAGKGPAAVEL